MSAKKTTTSKKRTARDTIIAGYMEYVLENERLPKSVYKFCKEQNTTEAEFYKNFGSFEGLQQEIWNSFFDHSMKLAHQNKGYGQFSNKEKMLTFFFTFFEMLTANRSYVLFALKEKQDMMKNLRQLKGLRLRVKEFSGSLIEEGNEEKQLEILKQPVSVFSEGAWLQTLFILKYWMEDNSPNFEKTDVVIEKSVRAVFDVFQTTPLESVLDFGKYLWKERFGHQPQTSNS
ncbi:TetR family transcriptional regulator C-terminal domain-containing protein [Marinirhabdus gelatinilytica]|uniref:AcrR family transcriptional regulator n=1 Tax=Marinirhabdus gelatinilytica TaxID=1703343 RepID=A0A370QB87_9FLAO|nr:TetR family transcriptional regulator C-terminal domain-containing protein [Marinirhabdus gelatinilytica]RDK85622.1 AcrR family transcriptional regulator [Marinirhabdus gelatinilytica]